MSDLISRQDAINAIENTDCQITSQEWDELISTIKTLPSARPTGEWIPCIERLPSEDEQESELGVIVTLGNGYSGLQYDWYHDGHWYDWDGFVIAWMPLPEPYRGGDTE